MIVHPADCMDVIKTRNPNNRSIRRNVVARIEADILAGRFHATHQSLAFDVNGMLQDGQHRLMAGAESKKGLKCWVHFNQPLEHFKVLDSGTARLASDNLAHYGVPRSTTVAPGLKNVLLYERYPERTWSNLPMPTTSEIFEKYNAHKELVDTISEACVEVCGKFKGLNKTGLFAACFLASTKGYSNVDILSFCGHLSSGANLSADSPILAYRNYVINNAHPKAGGNHQQFSLNCIIKAWNYAQKGIPLKQFKPPGFPPMMIIEPPALKNSIKISTSLRNQILERDDYTCQECGATEEDEVELQVDHKIPRSKGGSNEPSNLQVLCFDCNNEKSDNLTL